MRWPGVTYTARFNRRHSRSGHLFQGGFKSLLVEDDAYLVQLSCYSGRGVCNVRENLQMRALRLLSSFSKTIYKNFSQINP